MPTAVKERILNLITDAHQKYFEITQFFLDPSMSRSSKELKAYHFLENEILHLDSDFSDFPTSVDQLAVWVQKQNKTQCLHYKEYLERRENGSAREFLELQVKLMNFYTK